MSCPVSSRPGLILVEDALEGVVAVGVVGDAVVPGTPDHVDPGAGQDSDRLRMIVAAGDGALVEVGGPGVGVTGVGGEVADGVAQLLVRGPAEADGLDPARLAGGGGDPGQAGQGVGGGEAAAGVADLGEQTGGAHGARAGQAGEDVTVGVQGQLLADPGGQGLDLGGQGLDLGGQGSQHGHERQGRAGVDLPGVAGEAAGGAGQPLVQDGGVGASAVADRAQPGG